MAEEGRLIRLIVEETGDFQFVSVYARVVLTTVVLSAVVGGGGIGAEGGDGGGRNNRLELSFFSSSSFFPRESCLTRYHPHKCMT